MNLTDACDNAYHNGYEQGYTDALETVQKILEELTNKGDTKNGENLAKIGADKGAEDNGANGYCEHRNICALN